MKQSQITMSKGFTLIELIIYIALTSIFIVAAILFAWDIIYAGAKSSVQQELNHNLRFAAKRIAYEIRNAESVNSVTATSITLGMSDSARDPTVIDLSSGRIRIGFGSSGSCPISSPCFLTTDDISITTLNFTDLSSGGSENIRFSISAETMSDRSEFKSTQIIEGSGEVRNN